MVRFITSLMVSVVLVAALGCDRDGPSSGSATGGSSATSTPAPLKELRIGYFANLTHAQAVLGVASGEFERRSRRRRSRPRCSTPARR